MATGVKRLSPSEDLQSAQKKQRILKSVHHQLRFKQKAPDDCSFLLHEPEVEAQLTRAVGIALKDAGFDGATADAMEGFRAEIESYMTHFLDSVTSSMRACRRTQPIPQDFLYGLKSSRLTPKALEPYTKASPSPELTLPTLELAPQEESNHPDLTALLGGDLSGAADMATKKFIPSHFPAFPSKHTYKATPDFTLRVDDPKKIREQASQEGKMGENALRKLVNASSSIDQAANSSFEPTTFRKGRRRKDRESLWEKTMETISSQENISAASSGTMMPSSSAMETETDGGGINIPKPVGENLLKEMRGFTINSEMSYWRKGVTEPKPEIRKAAGDGNSNDAMVF